MQDLVQKFEDEIGNIHSEDELVRLKAAYLGKSGSVTERLKNLSTLPPAERPVLGAQINQLKTRIETACRERQVALAHEKMEQKLKSEAIDVTLPGRAVPKGGLHPVLRVLDEVEDIFREIGFSVHEGPDIETEFFNFEALNIPKDHPARDMQDTFYLQSTQLLRTHTSPVQIHVMKQMKPPIRMIAPGAVYRRDSDISHTPMFHQVEGLVVEEGARFSDLKGAVSYFLHRLFGESLRVRFRPSYFPFTEPSAEVDMQCNGGRYRSPPRAPHLDSPGPTAHLPSFALIKIASFARGPGGLRSWGAGWSIQRSLRRLGTMQRS